MMLIRTTFIFGILAATAYGCQIMKNVDIAFGKDLAWVRDKPNPQDCCGACSSHSGCVAFTWTNLNGGTCFLKSSSSPQKPAAGVTAGIVAGGSSSGCQIMYNVDISTGKDLTWVRDKPNSQDCCAACSSHSGCVAFTWTNLNGGTCFLKSTTSPQKSAPGVVAGIIAGGGGSPSGWKTLKEFDTTSVEGWKSEWDLIRWHNKDKETYLDTPTTLYVRDSAMVFRAKKQGTGFVSAGFESKFRFNANKVPSKKIRVEFTCTVPTAKGAWPAFWMTGDSEMYGSWPWEGELDVMEWVYQLGDRVQSAMHWGGGDWSHKFGFSRDDVWKHYYTYGVEISAVPNNEYVQFYVRHSDGNTNYSPVVKKDAWNPTYPKCSKFTPGASRCTPLAPFDNNIKLAINLAVGGGWGDDGVNGDYSAFDGEGIEMNVKRIVIYQG